MLRAIIVDDEAPARSELRFLLDETGKVDVVAEAANVREAIEKLKDLGADIMFLDVNMPGTDGLQLAEALTHLKYPPYVIFVTAYSEHAVKAFDVNATDYLVKPVETDRLNQAIAKVLQQVGGQGHSSTGERIPVEKGGKKLQEKAGRGLFVALLLFVGIPLPGTGAWTGTLAASLLDMDFKSSVTAVLLGVILAGVIMGLVSAGVFGALGAVF